MAQLEIRNVTRRFGDFVAGFIGHINQFTAQVVESSRVHLRMAVAGLGEFNAPPLVDAVVGSKGVFAIRPEQNPATFPSREQQLKLEMLHDLDRHQRRLLSRIWTEIKLFPHQPSP